MKRLFLLSVFVCTASISISQVSDKDTSASEFKPSFVALPLVFRTPETSWGFGAGAFYAFKWKNQSTQTRPSQFQIGFAYTLLNQVLSYLPFHIFTNNNRFQFQGELGYYRYVFDFYGVGNQIPADYRETFDVTFPRIRLQTLYRFGKSQYAGIRYAWDDYNITRTEPSGILAKNEVTGSTGNIVSMFSIVYLLDSRDNIFNTRRGWYVEALAGSNNIWLGSRLNYEKFIFDTRKFIPLGNRSALAVNVYQEYSTGNVPFNQMALLGGTRRLRGYYEGRYRDNHAVLLQTEYRFPVVWRFSGVVFGGAGLVSNLIEGFDFQYTRWAAGAGLRFVLSKSSGINLRLDYAFAKNSSGFYLTVGEAF